MPWRGTLPMVTSATCFTSTGMPSRSATTMLPISSAEREQADAADQELLAALLGVAAAGVGVAAAERGGELVQRDL